MIYSESTRSEETLKFVMESSSSPQWWTPSFSPETENSILEKEKTNHLDSKIIPVAKNIPIRVLTTELQFNTSQPQ